MQNMKKLAGFWFSFAALAAGAAGESTQILADFSRPETAHRTTASEAVCTPLKDGLRVETKASRQWPGIRIGMEGGMVDLSRFQSIGALVRNPGAVPLDVNIRVDDDQNKIKDRWASAGTTVPPHATKSVSVQLCDLPFRLSRPLDLIGLRGFPGQKEKIASPMTSCRRAWICR